MKIRSVLFFIAISIVTTLIPKSASAQIDITFDTTDLTVLKCSNFTNSVSVEGGVTPYTIELADAPDGVSLVKIDEHNYEIKGAPTETGTFYIDVQVEDDQGETNEYGFNLTVNDNTSPTITKPGKKTFVTGENTGKAITPFTISVSDAEDTPTVTVSGLPSGLTASSTTAPVTVSGTLSANVSGTSTVTVTANDGCNTAVTETFEIKVDVNSAPTVTAPGNMSYFQGHTITEFTITVRDEDDTPAVTVGTLTIPPGISYSESSSSYGTGGAEITYTFSGKVAKSASPGGFYLIGISANDGINNAVSGGLLFTVKKNTSPVITNPGDKSYYRGTAVSFDITVTDAEDTPSVEVSGLPNGLSYDESTGEVSGTVASSALSLNESSIAYPVTVTADDGCNPEESEAFTITINNRAPTFTDGTSTTRSFAENTTGGQNIGGAVAATDLDGDTLTYSLEGTDAGSFSINSGSGQLQTKSGVTYDYETKNSYSVTVKVVDDYEGSDAITVTINLTDVPEPPGKPAAPTQSGSTLNSLTMTWTAPTNTGPAITDYDVQYREGSSSRFTSWTHNGTGRTTTITGLERNTTYKVQVRASNAEGTGDWSDLGQGMTKPNGDPMFTAGTSTTRSFAENTTGITNIGSKVTATDPDRDPLEYSLEGTDAGSFSIVSTSGQLRTKSGVTYDYETKNSYSVTVKVVDDYEGSDAITVTINLTDVLEPPGKPAAPTQSGSTLNSLTMTWKAPENTGPAITDYDVQYRKSSSSGYTPWPHNGTALTTTITGLERNTTYKVQVRARNAEGIGSWSDLGQGMTKPNRAPMFTAGTSTTRSFAENTTGGQNIGGAVTATDLDGDPLEYSLQGTDAGSFSIVSTSGQLRTKSGVTYDYETKNSYSVTVKVVDDYEDSDAITVTINLTDVLEPPDKPTAPTVSNPTLNSLDVSWTAPTNTGPAITDYDVQYRKSSSSGYTSWTHRGTSTSTTITRLERNTTYKVQVRASNDEGTGDWSDLGQGTTKPNRAPMFTAGTSTTRSFAENTTGITNIGGAVTATDPDGDPLEYSLEGTDAGSFSIVSTSGQLRTKSGVTYDYETKNSYSVTVKVVDDYEGSDAITVTINLTDVLEPPGKPDAPTVSNPTLNSLDVSWTAPTNTGPAINDYDVQYRKSSSSRYTSWTHRGTSTSTTITGLERNTTYKVQVRARNAEGIGSWSDLGQGMTKPNRAPMFTAGTSTTRSFAENTTGITNIGGAVTATDLDGDPLEYSLQGTDAGSFSIVSTSGQLRTRSGVTYDYETKNSYSVTVKVVDGHGGSDVITVTVSLTDVLEPPGKPAAPTVSNPTLNSLDVSWTAPTNTGPAITDYDVQYRKGSSGGFTSWPHSGTDRTTTITGLDRGTTYEVQVLARNDEGDSPSSNSGQGTTNSNQYPVFTDGTSTTRSFAENTLGGQRIDDAVRAMDGNGDQLTYSLEEGMDKESFSINENTGQLLTKANVTYDYETKDEYSVIMKVVDGHGGSDVITVTINLTDELEPPEAPSPPTVMQVPNSLTQLTVRWTKPENTGPPINDYDVQYRIKDSGDNFTDAKYNGTALTTTLTNLTQNTTYEVQVNATNAEGTGDWSESGEGTTNTNVPPVFTEGGSTTRSFAENTAGGENIGNPVAATDSDGGTLTYSLEGDDAGSFGIISTSGQLQTKANVTYDYETKDSYSVRMKVEDGQGGSVTIDVTVNLTDETEAPGKPAVPVISGTTLNSLTVSWTAPENTGPEITDYDVQYRKGSSGGFTAWTHSGTDLTTTITGLDPDTGYEIQVNATNDEGTGDWSDSGSGMTDPNQLPEFSEGTSATRSFAENTTGGQNIGGAVTATDSDGGTLTYSLEGTDASSFDIVSTSGQLRTKANETYNYEVKDSYSVTVKVVDDYEGSATIAVTVSLTDVLESPGKPAAPTVPAATPNSLTVNWTAPENTGPSITDYNVQYRIKDSGDNFTDAQYDGTALTTTLTNLTQNTTYEVQVQAANAEGTGSWSDSGSGTTIANAGPVFTSLPAFSLAENSTTTVTVTATDSDAEDNIEGYKLSGGVDKALFGITNAGVLSFNNAPNFENPLDVISTSPSNAATNNEYVVVITATSGTGDRELTADQTIIVTVTDDETEAPGKPAVPTVSNPTLNSLTVTWTAPENTGPAITDYDVQYRKGSSGGFTSWTHSGTAVTTTITGLDPDTGYEIQVRASNAEGTGDWSDSGSGMTDPNQLPVFTDGASATRSFAENTAGGENIGNPVAATDSDGGTLTYSLEGTDASSFDIVSTSGQLQTKANETYNYEVKDSYSVTVKVVDDYEGSATIAVTVSLTDDDTESPGKPAAPTVPAATLNSLTVSWTAPENTGPAITDYDVQYRKGSSGGFTSWTHSGTSTSTTITGLDPNTTYEVQVQASNDEGTGDWSDSGSGTTIANAGPVFTSNAAFDVAENTTSVGTVVAEDSDAEDNIEGYAITGGVDKALFGITNAGVLSFNNAPNFENPLDVVSTSPSNAATNNEYVVVVTATSGTGDRELTADQTIIVTVTDDETEAPGKPAAPTVSNPTLNGLTVTWTVPENTGPSITDYNVQYRIKDSDDNFTDAQYDGTALTTTLTGLESDTTYEVQVQATNAEGTGDWSDSGSGTTTTDGDNQSPVFTSNAAFDVAENTTSVGTVVAEDSDTEDNIEGYAITGGVDKALFGITNAGVLSFNNAPNFENPLDVISTSPSNAATNNEYVVVITATSGTGDRALTKDQTLTITVTNVDEAGVVTFSSTDVPVGTALTATVSDPDGGVTSETWQWARSSDKTMWTVISGATSDSYTPVIDDSGNYLRATVSYTDAQGSGKSAQAVTDNMVRTPPIAGPGTITFEENTTLEVGGTYTYTETFPEDATLTWSVTGDLVDCFFIIREGRDKGKLIIGFAAKNYEDPRDANMDNVYVGRVNVSDGVDANGDADTAIDHFLDVVITVTNVDEAGVVTFSSTDVPVGTALTAMVSDPDGGITGETWQWARSSDKTMWTAISGATSDSYTPVIDDSGNYLRATVSYTDAQGSGKSAQAVTDNMVRTPPIAGPGTITFEENTTLEVVGTYTYTETFPEDATLTWSVTGDLVNCFFIAQEQDNERIGKLTIGFAAKDYENPADPDMDNEYVGRVNVSDGVDANGDADTAIDHFLDVVITVTNVDEAGVVTFSSTDVPVGTALTATVSDPDGGVTGEMWQWARSSDKTMWTAISGATSDSYTPVIDDSGNYLRATVSYTDAQGSGKSAQAVTDNMVRTPPIIGPGTITFEENTTLEVVGTYTYTETFPEDATLTWSVTGDLVNCFFIAQEQDNARIGKLTIGFAAKDYENPADPDMDNEYVGRVNVSDGVDANGDADTAIDHFLDVVITVTNVDEAGVVTFSASNVEVGVELTATVSDPDGGITGETWQWARSSDKTMWTAISGATSDSYTPVAGDSGNYLRATVSYTDAQGSGKSAQAVISPKVAAGKLALLSDTEFVPDVPDTFSIAQNYPNPFNPETTIPYALPQSVHVRLVIYNVLGQEIRTLVNEIKPAGYYRVVWDNKDDFGKSVSSGIYLYRIVAGDFVETKKLLLLK